IEISSLILAGACGLILGKSWMFPGTYTRLEGLIRGAKDSLKIAFSLVLFLLIAAFFESFVTRHTEMPGWLSTSILSGSLVLMVWYFVVYPQRVKRSFEKAAEEAQPVID
ncbi:MAG TPA: stage II sporulation protein M, partial [Chitinophagaceae bacterium]